MTGDNLDVLHLPDEEPIRLKSELTNEYIPMDDYAANGYKPFGPRKCHFCRACIDYYDMLYDKKVTKHKFMPRCNGDLSALSDDIDPDEFGDDYDYYQILQDPVAWAEFEFNWHARWYQKEALRCSSQFKAIRAGRRVGKTELMAILALWNAFTNGGLPDTQFEVLVVAPYQLQVAKIFDVMRLFIKRSHTMSMPGIVKRDVLNPQQIEFSSGGVIRGLSSGSHSGAKSDKIRGQSANLIILDEVDYIADSDIEVIMAILASHSDCQLIVASTPRGIRQKLHQWCTDKNQGFKEFWYISSESPSWTQHTEDVLRSMYIDSAYSREFDAEFGDEMEGVFRSEDINNAIGQYTYSQCTPHYESRYVIGVDWNKVTGTHIVVIEGMQIKNGPFKYRLVDKHIIRKHEFQQIAAVEKIIDLDKKWTNQKGYIYVDAGYGHVQVEMMWKIDVDKPSENTNYRERVVPVTMNQNIEIKDPVTGQPLKKQIKQFMVDNASRCLEKGEVIVPAIEDTTVRIVPEEVAYADIGLIQQMRNFTVTKWSPTGVPSYSQDYEHTLTAWMLALMGHLLQYSDINKIHSLMSIAYSGGFGSGGAAPESSVPGAHPLVPHAELNDAIDRHKKTAERLAPSKRGLDDGNYLLEQDAGTLIAGHQLLARSRRNDDTIDERKRSFGKRKPPKGRSNI